MKYVIKSQLSYVGPGDLYSIFLIHLGTILYSYIRDFNPVNLMCFLLFIQYATVVLINNSKENRDYTFNLLTITSREVALIRIILVMGGYLIIYLTALVVHLTLFYNVVEFKGGIHELFMFGGLALSGVFLYISLADYFSTLNKKTEVVWFNIIIGFIIAIISFGAIISVENSYTSSKETSSILIILFYLSSIFFAWISYNSYQKRESYLGYK